MSTTPALCEPSPSQAFPSPSAPAPVFVSPSLVSGAPGAESPVLHAPAAVGHALAPDVLVQQFHGAYTKKPPYIKRKDIH